MPVSPNAARSSPPAVAPSPPAPAAEEDALYPCSDGKPMADNMWQAKAMFNAFFALGMAHPDALVATDILVYPEQGNPNNRIAPDVLVALGLGTHNRSSYFVWREGKPPDWVLEVASPGTSRKDLDDKRRTYAAMGVPEYWLFDPKGDQFPRRGKPRLQGLTLVGGAYRPLRAAAGRGEGPIRSRVLELDLRAEGELLRFRDPATGEDIRHVSESEALAAREAVWRKAAEARAARETARAERESLERKAAEARAERESLERKAAQARVAELEAALDRTRTDPRD